MRTVRFTFVVDEGEKEALARLAKQLQRSQSDTLRWLLRKAMDELHATADKAPQQEVQSVAATR
jgi:hypothetical protein